ncbi:MAG: lipoyl(octanoyl) transferase LipB [Rhodobacteraceae bacterium]|nr:lipoyl(octanoyl) transferase LipB [Paracoccaceae bacterium]
MVDWIISEEPVELPHAIAEMERRSTAIANGVENEAVWLLEHPHLFTLGTSGIEDHIVQPTTLPVHRVGRGGQVTYHGPGQRIAYLMLNLNDRRRDVRNFVRSIEKWIILTLSEFGIEGETRDNRVGIWVQRPDDREDKIAAIGIRLRRWVSLHGVSINVDPDLRHYASIVPCGIREHGVTSMTKLGKPATMGELDRMLKKKFNLAFGPDSVAKGID